MDKASVRIILYKSKTLADGTHPIQLQYNINGRRKSKSLTSCLPDDWDAKNSRLKSKVRNSSTINHYLTEQFTEAERLVFDIRMGNANVSEIFNPVPEVTLSAAFDAELSKYKAANRAATYRRILSNKKTLSEMIDINIDLSKIDLQWFEHLLKKLQGKGHAGLTDAKIIKTVRTVIARHVKVPLPENVKVFRVSSAKPVKQKLTGDELAAIERLSLDAGSSICTCRDIFLLQVYLRGARIGDVLQSRCDQFKDGRFIYEDGKTGKFHNIALIDKAAAIVAKYTGNGDLLFPVFRWAYNKKISAFDNALNRVSEKGSATTFVNKHLKQIAEKAGIKKPLSSHIARHTFARMAIDKINNPMVTMELLGHSSLAVHQQYLNDIRKEDILDKAAGDIFG